MPASTLQHSARRPIHPELCIAPFADDLHEPLRQAGRKPVVAGGGACRIMR